MCNRCVQLEHKVKRLERYMSDYIGLANVVRGFVDITPEHVLHESIRGDVINYLAKIDGKTEFDIPSGPCEWWFDSVDETFGTSCNRSFDSMEGEYCPYCQGKIELLEDDD